MGYPTLYVLRHGETEWNREGRFQGALHSPLTELGRAQAERQARILAGLDLDGVVIRVSPQARAFQTAAIALSGHGADLHTDDRLRELEVGDWSGQHKDEITAVGATKPDAPDGWLAQLEFAPGGEGLAALRARCESFLDDLSGPTLCVTHGVTGRMLRGLALGLPVGKLEELPGGQGNVHIVEEGRHRTLS